MRRIATLGLRDSPTVPRDNGGNIAAVPRATMTLAEVASSAATVPAQGGASSDMKHKLKHYASASESHYSQRPEDPRRLRDLVVHRTDALHLLAEPCAVGVERTELRTKGSVCLGLRRHGLAVKSSFLTAPLCGTSSD